jgi:hypothetical protein|tara:strand:- start:51 stop:299 length:249 start_codon:yes stop_codon:yes gene_type:complete
MSNIIDTISSMSSSEAREHLKVNGYDDGSIAEVMAEWEEIQNNPAPAPAPKPASPRKTNQHTHNDGTTHSHPNSGEHEHDDE